MNVIIIVPCTFIYVITIIEIIRFITIIAVVIHRFAVAVTVRILFKVMRAKKHNRLRIKQISQYFATNYIPK